MDLAAAPRAAGQRCRSVAALQVDDVLQEIRLRVDKNERVLITITGDDPYGGDEVTQATVVDPACREVQGSPGMVTPLSDEGLAAWAQGGLPVTLYGLIGPQG